MNRYAIAFLIVAVAAVGVNIRLVWMLRRAETRTGHATTSRDGYRLMLADLRQRLRLVRKDAADKLGALRVENQRDREATQGQMATLRSQNQRLRTWQHRVINGNPLADLHLAAYIGELDPETCLLADQLGNNPTEPEEGR